MLKFYAETFKFYTETFGKTIPSFAFQSTFVFEIFSLGFPGNDSDHKG